MIVGAKVFKSIGPSVHRVGGLAKSGVLKQFWVFLRPDDAGRNGK